jgi:hypothetical protein
MKRSTSKLATLVVLGGLLAACSDDNGTGPTPQPEPELAAPSGVAVSALGPNLVRVSFAPVTGASEYVIERAQGTSGGSFAQTGTTSSTSWEDSGVQAQTTYRYRVAARAGTRQSPFSGEALIATSRGGPAGGHPHHRHHVGPDPLRRHRLPAFRLHQGGERSHPHDRAGHHHRG